MKNKKRLLLLGVIMAVSGATLAGCGSKSEAVAPDTVAPTPISAEIEPELAPDGIPVFPDGADAPVIVPDGATAPEANASTRPQDGQQANKPMTSEEYRAAEEKKEQERAAAIQKEQEERDQRIKEKEEQMEAERQEKEELREKLQEQREKEQAQREAAREQHKNQ